MVSHRERKLMNALLNQLPPVNQKRLAVRVTPDAHRQVRGGSPWLYDGSITAVNHEGAPGDLAVVFDDERNFVAIGLWDPESPIRVKMLHAGKPVQIDAAFWRNHISNALDRRTSLTDDPTTTGYRCIHGENDGFPGLVVDRYEETLVVKLYTAAWFPHLAAIVAALDELLSPKRVMLRLSRGVALGETFGLADGDALLGGAPTTPVLFRERGLVMEADVVHGNKTGHFLDQRDNRALVRGMAKGLTVLDVFSNTGGFALSAAAGGATSVHLIDQSAPALATAERNMHHNRHLREVRECEFTTTVGDAFDVLDDLAKRHQRFDIVILDPPSFASNQTAVPGALKAYARLTRSGMNVVKDGGVLIQASCSSRVTADDFADTVLATANANGRVNELRRTGHPADHPISFEFGGYLKVMYLSVKSAGTKN